MSNRETQSPRASEACFVTTRWSVVLAAKDQRAPGSDEALEALCRIYWYPLYAYIRHHGKSPEDAQDLTQEFFSRLLQKQILTAVEQEKGKFRTFLLVVLKRFMADEWDRARAQKRGGGQAHFSLDTALAERLYREEPTPKLPAEKIYERRWALALLEEAMNRLRQEFVAAGKGQEYESLKGFLTAEKGMISYAEVASQLGMNEGAARVAVHRLRRRFREVFREEIAQTVAKPEEVEEEIRYLLTVLGEG